MSTGPSSDGVMSCQGCGASIYREHLDRGLAGRWAGNLLCPHCLSEKRGGGAGADLEHLSRADETEGGPQAGRSSSHTGLSVGDLDSLNYKRPLNPAGPNATRVRIFHCKLTEGPVVNLNQQVNDWLDSHPDIQIKFANTTIGTWEGKHAEQHIILTLYY
jgi:hypothetical protein